MEQSESVRVEPANQGRGSRPIKGSNENFKPHAVSFVGNPIFGNCLALHVPHATIENPSGLTASYMEFVWSLLPIPALLFEACGPMAMHGESWSQWIFAKTTVESWYMS